MQTKEVMVFFARNVEKVCAVGLSNDEVCNRAGSEEAQLNVSSAVQAVPVIPGERVNAENGAPHVAWKCPICGQLHVTDLGEGDPNPSLWFCEQGETERDVCLVSW